MQVLTHAGGIGVASTKAFASQVTVLTLLAMHLAMSEEQSRIRFRGW